MDLHKPFRAAVGKAAATGEFAVDPAGKIGKQSFRIKVFQADLAIPDNLVVP
ncbi:MAG: hypothetical protein ACD_75C02282G0002 [uncultured bacterium]|nr:MAG: hypothetical protein ACD_75C02282G0002 [uncultured bacterium]